MEHICWIYSSFADKLRIEPSPEKRLARETLVVRDSGVSEFRTGKIEIVGQRAILELKADLAKTEDLIKTRQKGGLLIGHLLFVDLFLNPKLVVSVIDNVTCLRFRIIGLPYLFLKVSVSHSDNSQTYTEENFYSFDVEAQHYQSRFPNLDPSAQRTYVADGRDKERVSTLDSMLKKYAGSRTTEIVSTVRATNQFSYLDLGCGDMSITNSVSNYYLPDQTFGVDIFNHSDEGKITYGTSTPHYVKAKDLLPFSNGIFSLITCFVSIHHFKNLYTSLAEMTRCAKIGALLFIREHDVKDQTTADYLELIHFVDEILREKKGLDSDYFSRYNRKETLVGLLSSFGWREIGTETYDADKNPQRIYHSLFILEEHRASAGAPNDDSFFTMASKEWKSRRPIVNYLPDKETLVKVTKKRLLYAPWAVRERRITDEDIFAAYQTSTDEEAVTRLIDLFSGKM